MDKSEGQAQFQYFEGGEESCPSSFVAGERKRLRRNVGLDRFERREGQATKTGGANLPCSQREAARTRIPLFVGNAASFAEFSHIKAVGRVSDIHDEDAAQQFNAARRVSLTRSAHQWNNITITTVSSWRPCPPKFSSQIMSSPSLPNGIMKESVEGVAFKVVQSLTHDAGSIDASGGPIVHYHGCDINRAGKWHLGADQGMGGCCGNTRVGWASVVRVNMCSTLEDVCTRKAIQSFRAKQKPVRVIVCAGGRASDVLFGNARSIPA